MKHFTRREAEALIPALEDIFTRALMLRDRAEARAASVRDLDKAGDAPARAAMERGQLRFLVDRVNECLAEVASLGAVPKGLDPALVDFPCLMDGGEVYLCWTKGEKTISHYHGLEEGFSGRKPLPQGRPIP